MFLCTLIYSCFIHRLPPFLRYWTSSKRVEGPCTSLKYALLRILKEATVLLLKKKHSSDFVAGACSLSCQGKQIILVWSVILEHAMQSKSELRKKKHIFISSSTMSRYLRRHSSWHQYPFPTRINISSPPTTIPTRDFDPSIVRARIPQKKQKRA